MHASFRISRARIAETDAQDWISSVNKGGLARTFLIVDATSGDVLGAIEVRLGEVGSIGYWVTKQARGRGIATRATMLLSRWAVTEGDVERLELTTHPENAASQRVAEKAGFTREGVLRSPAKFREGRRDSVIFSLLPEDAGLGRFELGPPLGIEPTQAPHALSERRVRHEHRGETLLGERVHRVERLGRWARAEFDERACRLQPQEPVGEPVRRLADLEPLRDRPRTPARERAADA